MATLYQVGKNWYLNFRQGGKQVRKSLGPNEKYARRQLDLAQDRIERGLAGLEPRPEKKTLGSRLDAYILHHSQGKAPKTVVRYKGMARGFLDFFGPNLELDTVSLRRYVDHRLSQVKSKTVNNELVFIRSVYSDHGPGSHPFRTVKNLPVRDAKDIRYLTEDEPSRLLKACSGGINRKNWPDLADYVAAYLYLGVRLDELNLTWRDITPAGARITNLKTYGKHRGDKYRIVPIHPSLAVILDRRRNAGLAVPYPPHHPNSLRRAISRAASRAGLAPGVGVHSLRHTFASELLLRGVGLYALSRLLGHSSQTTTAIYSHLQPQTFEKAIALLPDY